MEAIADYTGLRPLAHGEPGLSYLAEPPARLGVAGPVVLAVVGTTLEPERLREVADELRLVAGIDSPFVLRLLDVGDDGGRAFYAVEDLDRGTLADPAGELERSGTLKVVADAARGAHALHEAGIAHGAISPRAVILHDEGAKLGDLGLARFAGPGMTVTSATPAATVECTDPAVVRGEPPGRASDIWSLGLTLHGAVTGRSAYAGEVADGDLQAVVLRVLSSRPVLAEGLDPAVASIVTACLQPDPDDRPQTALAVAELVEDLL
jgi:serine/threonine protein kinase